MFNSLNQDKLVNTKFVQKNWEDLVMKFLSNSMDKIDDEDKICEIAKSFGAQLEALYINSPDEKVFLFSHDIPLKLNTY